MSARKDICGNRYGQLTVLEYVPSEKPGSYYKCICDCGNVIIAAAGNLKRGNTKTCGDRKIHHAKNYYHGLSNSRIFKCWAAMISRCCSSSDKRYKNYGQRGIKVCDEWKGKTGFMAFYTWAIENGYQEDLTIDRIDVNGNYEPGNCRWITNKEQQNNRRDTVYLEHDGEKHSLAEWCEIYNLPYRLVHKRYSYYKKGNREILFEKIIH